ncbi:MAG: hypothetical protein AAGD13_05380 [Pseudomonadota bacterium]
MTIRLRPPSEPFEGFLKQARALIGFWAKFVGGTVLVSLVLGVFAPLAIVAFLLTLGLPILMLVLWGRALDQELGWTELDEGPW